MFADRKYIIPLVHVVIWTCLFFYPFIFHYLPLNDLNTVARISLSLLLLAGFFYANTFVLIPKILGKKKIIYYLIIIVFSITAISFSAGYLQVIFNPGYDTRPELFSRSFNTGIITAFITWFISTSIKVTSEWFKNQQLMKSIENEKLNAELNFLKSQVNPHFLFNALNNIYSLQAKNSPDTGSAILKLSELVRYMLYETSHQTVSLEKEIDYLVNYIELQKLGISKEVKVHFETKGEVKDKKIEPMLLIPIVENSFKHGISYKNASPLHISLSVAGNKLELMTQNSFSDNKQNTKANAGIGLSNLRKRLGLLYPGKHQLSALGAEDKFNVHLKLTLND